MSLDDGVKLVLPDCCFPRYRYYRNHLKSVIKRLKNIIDGGHLEKLVFNCKEKLKAITDAMNDFCENVEVSLFDKHHELRHSTLMVNKAKLPEVKPHTSLPTFIKETNDISPRGCYIAVFVIPRKQEYKTLIRRLSILTENQQDNILIFFTDNRKVFKYKDVLQSNQFAPNADNALNTVSDAVQFLLEIKIIHAFDEIRNFIHHFVPLEKFDLTHFKTLAEKIRDACRDNDVMPCDNKSSVNLEKQEFLSRVITCTLCEVLSRVYGISTCMVHCILSQSIFENDVASFCKFIVENTKPSNKHQLEPECKAIQKKAEETVQEVMPFLDKMMKLEFEVKGHMQHSKVSPTFTRRPYLPANLCSELLRFENIVSFGHKYGKLVIDVKRDKELSPEELEDIAACLRKYGYMFPFSTETELADNAQANSSSSFEHGNQIRIKSKGLNENKTYDMFFATLGCFVKLRKTQPKANSGYRDKNTCLSENFAEMVLTDGSKEEKKVGNGNMKMCKRTLLDKLYAITCAHCVHDCQDMVEVSRIANQFECFGKIATDLMLKDDDCKNVDLAFIEILSDKIKNCEFKVRRPFDVEPTSNWQVYSDTPVKEGTCVYIIGGTVRLSQGIVVQADTVKRIIVNEKLNLRPMFTLLIEPLSDCLPGNEALPFSEKGDSGSIVWFDDPNGNLYALALLCGALVHSSGQYSYASYTKTLFDIFSEKKKLTVEPACSRTEMEKSPATKVENTEIEGAVGGE